MVFDDFKPGCMYGGTQLCGLAMPHMAMSSSGMHLETTDLQKSMEEMHGRLETDHDTYHPYQCSTAGSGKRSGPQIFQKKIKINMIAYTTTTTTSTTAVFLYIPLPANRR